MLVGGIWAFSYDTDKEPLRVSPRHPLLEKILLPVPRNKGSSFFFFFLNVPHSGGFCISSDGCISTAPNSTAVFRNRVFRDFNPSFYCVFSNPSVRLVFCSRYIYRLKTSDQFICSLLPNR